MILNPRRNMPRMFGNDDFSGMPRMFGDAFTFIPTWGAQQQAGAKIPGSGAPWDLILGSISHGFDTFMQASVYKSGFKAGYPPCAVQGTCSGGFQGSFNPTTLAIIGGAAILILLVAKR
jgi:hypothetical protein